VLSFRLSPEDLDTLRPKPTRPVVSHTPSQFACTPTVALPRPQSVLRPRLNALPEQRVPVVPTADLALGSAGGVDTWAVPRVRGESRLYTLCCVVLCRRPRTAPARGLLLPQRGHLETASAVTHLWSALAFLGYAVARAATVELDTSQGFFLVLSAFFGSMTFFGSTLYHVTTPDDQLAQVGRQIDFLGIYSGVAAAFTADLCIVTRGFSSVPLVAILDVPLAVTLVAAFFAYRRYVLPGETTLVVEYECSRVGLFRRWHGDLDSTPVRQATSLTVALFAFVLTPALFRNLDAAPTVVALQVSSFLLVVGGMVLDCVLCWPDAALPKWAVWPNLGCVVTSHSLWHVAASTAGVLTLVAREIAYSEV
jgi:predicted membrane channel-forming protein YqfA (hemolysin III family)